MLIYNHTSEDTYEKTLPEIELTELYKSLLRRQANFKDIHPPVKFTLDEWLLDYKILWYTHFPDIHLPPRVIGARKLGPPLRSLTKRMTNYRRVKDGSFKKLSSLQYGPIAGAPRGKNPGYKGIIINSIEYPTVIAGAKAHDISPNCCRARICSTSPTFKDWNFIKPLNADK